MDNVSAGEVGGIMAGAIASVAAFAKGAAWLLNWNDARRDNKEERLAAWEKSLAERERAYRAEIEDRLDYVQKELDQAKGITEHLTRTVSALVVAVGDLAAELESHAPDALSLIRAKRMLESLKLTPTPPDLATLAHQIDMANVAAAKR